jgi:uncharacterized RDD family membrane protein YckC
MNCPRCGELSDEVCRCGLQSSASTEPVANGENNNSAEADPFDQESSTNDEAWRDELSNRLNRYRARRKIRPPRYPSLSLPFERPPLLSPSGRDHSSPPLEPYAESSLAVDPVGHIDAREEKRFVEPPAPPEGLEQRPVAAQSGGAKVIEFPRFAWAPPPPPPDQLAEPMMDRPRILEVPETAPPPPALGGITIEPAEPLQPERRPGIDFPLQSASLARRVSASIIDGVIVSAAATLFGLIFWKIDNFRPPTVQLSILALAIPCVSWAVYQYLLSVYSGRTLGLMAAGLELARFDGTPTNRSIRRWRILASYLSAASLGMGYMWVFLDEDALCWHDRITHTYLAPKNKPDR